MDVKDTSVEARDNRCPVGPRPRAAVHDADLPDTREPRMSSGGCWRTTRVSPVRRATCPSRRLATGPRRWTCCSGRARDDRDCHGRSEPCWPGGAGDAGRGRGSQGGGPGSRPGPPRSPGRPPARIAPGYWRWWHQHRPGCRSPGSTPVTGAACRYCWTGWSEQPGRTWQQRWLASGADAAGEQWAAGPARWLRRRGLYSASRLELMTSSLLVLVGADVIRPSLAWLLTGGKKRKLARNMICSRDPGGFARLRQFCRDDPAITPAARAKVAFRCAVIIAAKGGALADITIGDVLEVLDAERAVRARRDSGAATFRVLREMGVFGPGVPTLREILDTGQRTVEELVDRYPIACRPVRDLIVDYLKERQPAIDYVTLRNRSSQLARSFWADLEHHHPGIDSLRLPRDVAAAWKQRLQTKTTTATTATGETMPVTDGAAQLPRHPRQRPGLLPRPGRMGAGRPGPVGSVGGPLPDPARGPGATQVHPPPQGQDGRPDP